MKKIWLIAFLFNSPLLLFSLDYNLDLFTNFESYGGKGSVSLLDFCYYQKQNLINYGVSINLDTFFPKVPVEIKTGNLSFTGGISKLNSPSLTSTPTPFSSYTPATLYNKSSLPSYTSYSKEQSVFMQAGFTDRTKPLQKLLFSAVYAPYSTGTATTASFLVQVRPVKNFTIYTSASLGLFPFEEKTNSSWFSEKLYYHKDTLFSANFNLSAKTPLFVTNNFLTLYESPFGQAQFTFRNENSLKTRRFHFNLAEFYNPNEQLYTSSQKFLTRQLQIKAGSSYQTVTGQKMPFFLKLGTSSFFDYDFENDECSTKLSAGFKLTGQDLNTTGTITANGTVKKEGSSFDYNFSSLSISVQNKMYTKILTPSLNTGFSFSPGASTAKTQTWTTTEKIQLGLSFGNKFYVTNTAALNIRQKNFIFDQLSFDDSLTLKLKLNHFSLTGKITFETFDYTKSSSN